jgi:TonB family protein
VSRLRKEEPARAAQPAELASTEAAAPVAPEKFAEAAAAAAAVGSFSSQPRTVEAVSPVAFPVSPVAAEPVVSEPVMPAPVMPEPVMPKMISVAPDAAAAPDVVEPAPATSSIISSAMISSATLGSSPSPLPALPRQPSDDPVLAELEQAETEPERAIFSSYVKPQESKKGHGLWVTTLLLALTGGGFYAAWMYQPGFRGLVQAQLQRVMALAGTANHLMGSGAHPQTASRPPVKAATPQTPPAAPQASASSPGPVSADTSSPARPASQSIAAPAAAAATAPAITELAGENDAVILTSKGAERRLIHRVEPAYPQDVRSQRVEGTVVLKTLVNENGTVEEVRLIEGNPTLAEPAISAVRQWRYKPYVRDGKAKPFQTIVLLDVP